MHEAGFYAPIRIHCEVSVVRKTSTVPSNTYMIIEVELLDQAQVGNESKESGLNSYIGLKLIESYLTLCFLQKCSNTCATIWF